MRKRGDNEGAMVLLDFATGTCPNRLTQPRASRLYFGFTALTDDGRTILFEHVLCWDSIRSVASQSNAEGMPAQDDQPPTTEGSWTPFVLICVVLAARWLASSKSDFPIKFRRWVGKQKVQAKKKLGYRDEEKYKMSAGSGADQRLKRQG